MQQYTQDISHLNCLQAEETFEWPDFDDKKTGEAKSVDDYKKLVKEQEKELHKTWSKRDVPAWFR